MDTAWAVVLGSGVTGALAFGGNYLSGKNQLRLAEAESKAAGVEAAKVWARQQRAVRIQNARRTAVEGIKAIGAVRTTLARSAKSTVRDGSMYEPVPLDAELVTALSSAIGALHVEFDSQGISMSLLDEVLTDLLDYIGDWWAGKPENVETVSSIDDRLAQGLLLLQDAFVHLRDSPG